MARYNEILAGRYNRMLQKVFGMKGGAVAPQLASEIAPSIVLFNGAENRYLEGWDRFGVGFGQAAVAAQSSGVRFRNPAGSNVIAVVEKLTVSESVADVTGALFENGFITDLASLDVNRRLDGRGRSAATCITSHTSNPPSAVQFATLPLQANVPYDFVVDEDQELTVLPGDGIQVRTGQNNVLLLVTIIWRERFLEDSERT
jgi:hypothetical protein